MTANASDSVVSAQQDGRATWLSTWSGTSSHPPQILDGRRENWFESWSFARLWQLGIEPPGPQVAVYDPRDRFLGRVDGLWLDEGVVAEADGSGKYLGAFGPDGASGEAAARVVLAEKSARGPDS